ncbi:MAG: hypothetical protein EXR64_05900 [Dehalococcoidia bacterium]|nr:hypothetical protein [Dehalococcoidia bacterium]
MRRNMVLAAVAAALVVVAVAAAGFATLRARGDWGGDGAALIMVERWLRDDATSGVEVFPGVVAPVLDQLLNGSVTKPAERITLPVHPNARLLGSSYIHQGDGTDLVWVMYDVDGDIAAVAQVVAEQLNRSPWQVSAGLGQDTSRVLRFRNSRLTDIDGTAIVRLNPNAARYRVTVSRGGTDTTLTVKLTALAPSLGVGIDGSLAVGRVDPGPAQEAGVKQGDRIVRVNDTTVTNPQQLAAALQAVANAGSPRSALTYIVAASAPGDPAAGRAFVPPQQPIVLPQTFPARQAWQGLTVLRYAWGEQPGGGAFQASLVSKDSAAVVAARVRDGLRAEGWQITGETPNGFATQLQIANASSGLSGQVSIDQYAEDSAYLQVVVQIQSGQATGRP